MVKAALNDPDEDVRALAEGIMDFSDEDDPSTAPRNAAAAQPQPPNAR